MSPRAERILRRAVGLVGVVGLVYTVALFFAPAEATTTAAPKSGAYMAGVATREWLIGTGSLIALGVLVGLVLFVLVYQTIRRLAPTPQPPPPGPQDAIAATAVTYRAIDANAGRELIR